MANFFKDYHAQIRADREAEEKAKGKPVEYYRGQVIYINPMYDKDRNGKRYFVENLSDTHVLLAKNKKDAMNGLGFIYDRCSIVR